MKIKYVRVSTSTQNTSRQVLDSDSYDRVFVDKASGRIPFFERPKGKIISELLLENQIEELHIQSVDRLGRNLVSTLETIERFNECLVPIVIQDLGIRTIENGQVNFTVKILFQILSIFSELENTLRKERQMEGIHVAKLKGKYHGRKKGSSESVLEFLSKPKNKRALELLKEGNLNQREIARTVRLHYNTVGKIKELGF